MLRMFRNKWKRSTDVPDFALPVYFIARRNLIEPGGGYRTVYLGRIVNTKECLISILIQDGLQLEAPKV